MPNKTSRGKLPFLYRFVTKFSLLSIVVFSFERQSSNICFQLKCIKSHNKFLSFTTIIMHSVITNINLVLNPSYSSNFIVYSFRATTNNHALIPFFSSTPPFFLKLYKRLIAENVTTNL